MTTLDLTVPSMACGACAETITKAVLQVDSAATVTADPKTKLVQIRTSADNGAVTQAIEAAGYPVQS